MSQLIEGKLGMLQISIQNAHEKLDEAAQNAEWEITHFYNQIRQALEEREIFLKQKVSEHYQQADASLRAQERRISAHLQSIQQLYSEIAKSENEDELGFLSKSNFRLNIIRNATINIEELRLELPFSELNKEQEVMHLVKLLNPKQVSQRNENQQSTAVQSGGNNNKYPRIINVTQMMLTGGSKKATKSTTAREPMKYHPS